MGVEPVSKAPAVSDLFVSSYYLVGSWFWGKSGRAWPELPSWADKFNFPLFLWEAIALCPPLQLQKVLYFLHRCWKLKLLAVCAEYWWMAFDMEGSMLVERKVDAVTYVNIAYPLVMLSLSLLSLFCFLMGKSPSNYSISERRSYLLKSVSPLLTAAFVWILLRHSYTGLYLANVILESSCRLPKAYFIMYRAVWIIVSLYRRGLR